MANSGPNTNGSQFQLSLAKTEWLDGKNVVFGSVVDGMKVLEQMSNYGSREGETKKRIVIADCGAL